MASALTERYDDRISGVLSCYDRIVVTGTLPTVCYAEGMTRFLYARQIRIFDYPEFAMTLRDRVREAAATVATKAGVVDRACRQEPRSQGSHRCEGIGTAWRSSRPGARHLGDGGLRRLQAVARQTDAQDLPASGQRQVPALLFLLYGPRTGLDLPAGSHLVAVPPAILLQRP